MSRTKPALPVTTKLDYTTIDGTPTIQIAASLTTQSQVAAMIHALEKLGTVLPEAKVRRVNKAKAKPARAARTNNEAVVEIMTKKPKQAVMSDEDRAAIENLAHARARAEYQDEVRPQREREEFEGFKRMVRSGDSSQISSVIFQALTRANIGADVALREYIAELIDAGRDNELNLQLRFYLVQYLVHPLVRPLQSWTQE